MLPLQFKEYVKINANQVGLFRVAYTSNLWTKLLDAASAQKFEPIDRLNIANDVRLLAVGDVSLMLISQAFSLAVAGIRPTSQFLSLLGVCVLERHRQPTD